LKQHSLSSASHAQLQGQRNKKQLSARGRFTGREMTMEAPTVVVVVVVGGGGVGGGGGSGTTPQTEAVAAKALMRK
jgi:hypothetical protein